MKPNKVKIKYKLKEIKLETSDKELICLSCGFVTFGYRDMIEHLANYVNERGHANRRYRSENCHKQVIKYGRKKKK